MTEISLASGVSFEFVEYGTPCEPLENTLVLDVGMKCVPGVIDHHQYDALPECTASLIVRTPSLVLDHLSPDRLGDQSPPPSLQRIITHRFPDFDAISSIFLSFKLLETGTMDLSMRTLAEYTRMVDSATLPKDIDLSATPCSILRALFRDLRLEEAQANPARVEEGLKFMTYLYTKSLDGQDIIENRSLFSGIDRYEKARRYVEEDYFRYLTDLEKAEKFSVNLPLISGRGIRRLDGLAVSFPRSLLLKEWAQRDRDHPSLKQGYSLLLTQFQENLFILGVDPKQGVNLRGLGELLNGREKAIRESRNSVFSYRWYEGNNPFFDFRIVDSPREGTVLRFSEVLEVLEEFSLLQGLRP